jgi:hypothetical protein
MRQAGLLAIGTVFVREAVAQAGFSPLPYSFIQPANHSCVLQAKLPSCPEQDPMMVCEIGPSRNILLLNSLVLAGGLMLRGDIRYVQHGRWSSLATRPKLSLQAVWWYQPNFGTPTLSRTRSCLRTRGLYVYNLSSCRT